MSPLQNPMPDPKDLLHYQKQLRRLALSLVRDEALADDVVQETFLSALESPPRSHLSLRSWLRRVAWNRSLVLLREQRRRARRESRTARPEVETPAFLENLAHDESVGAVLRHLVALPEEQRVLLVQRYFAEMTPAEIAEDQNLSAKTVRKKITSALATLRKSLDRDRSPSQLPEWRAGLLAFVAEAPELQTHLVSRTLASPRPRFPAPLLHPWLTATVAASLLLPLLWFLQKPDETVDAPPEVHTRVASDRHPDKGPRETDPQAPAIPRDSVLNARSIGTKNPTALPSLSPSLERFQIQVVHRDGTPAIGVRAALLTPNSAAPPCHALDLRSSSEGRIVLPHRTPGLWSLHLDRVPGPIEVVLDEKTETQIVFPLGITVEGRVEDETGRPMPGAEILISGPETDSDRGAVVATANRSGEFLVRSISTSSRWLRAKIPGRSTSPVVLIQGGFTTGRLPLVLVLANEGHRVEGRIVDEEGNGLAHVEVTAQVIFDRKRRPLTAPQKNSWSSDRRIRCAPQVSTKTDEQGAFLFSGLMAETGFREQIVLAAHHPHFAPKRWKLDPEKAISISRIFPLAAAAILQGTVVDSLGNPVAGAEVTASSASERNRERKPATRTTSGTDGSFELVQVPAESQVLRAYKAGRGSFTTSTHFTPGTHRIDLKLLSPPHQRVVGTVKGPDGPIPNCTVRIRVESTARNPERKDRGSSPDLEETSPDLRGHFRFENREGPQILEVYGPAGSPIRKPIARAIVRPGRKPIAISVPRELLPSGTVTGRILLDPSNSQREVTVKIVNPTGTASSHPVPLRAGGEFRFDLLPPGRFKIIVEAVNPSCPTSSVPVLLADLELESGEQLDLGSLRAKPPGNLRVHLHRYVDAGDHRPGLYVLDESRTHRSWPLVHGHTATLNGLPPGDYFLCLENGFLKASAAVARPFAIQSDRETVVNLNVEQGVEVRIDLLSEASWSIGSWRLEVFQLPSQDLVFSTRREKTSSSSQGRWLVLKPSPYRAQVRTSTGLSGELDFRVLEHPERLRIEVPLAP